MVEKKNLKTWVEIDKSTIQKNYETFRSLLSQDTKLMAVVKSNAYGHDLVQFSQEMEKSGIDFLGVDSIEEALELRENNIQSLILVFGYVPKFFYQKAIDQKIILTISNFEALKNCIEFKDVVIHIEVDTNLGRQGFLTKNQEDVLEIIKNNNLKVEGLYTHFAVAEDPQQLDFTKGQVSEFQKWVDSFKQAGISPMLHTSASAETIRSNEFHFDMVRVGIGMYGLWPSKEIKEYLAVRSSFGSRTAKQITIQLHPVLSWKTIISEIKELPSGYNIGYDLTEVLKRDSKIAVCPIGYWHGYPRSLSKIGEVMVKGKKARVLGRISMDMIVIDITDISDAKVGDEVSLIDMDINVD